MSMAFAGVSTLVREASDSALGSGAGGNDGNGGGDDDDDDDDDDDEGPIFGSNDEPPPDGKGSPVADPAPSVLPSRPFPANGTVGESLGDWCCCVFDTPSSSALRWPSMPTVVLTVVLTVVPTA
jgi:hypothetical protein